MKRTSSRGHHPPPAHAAQSCAELVTIISDYIDGELSSRDWRALEGHLAECVCCGRLAADLRRSIVLCRAAGATILPAAVRRRARARIAELLQTMTPARARDRGSRTVAPRAVRSPRARRQR